MNCIISSENTDDELKAALNTGAKYGCIVSKEPYYLGDEKSTFVWLFSISVIKKNILKLPCRKRSLRKKCASAKQVFEELQQFKPNGYFISNGPGDPAQWTMPLQP